MFAKCSALRRFFDDRHKLEFRRGSPTAPPRASPRAQLVITSIGRDLLSLIRPFAVMACKIQCVHAQLVVVAAGDVILRKMIRRTRFAHDQFTAAHAFLNVAGEMQACAILKERHGKRRCAAAASTLVFPLLFFLDLE